MVNWTGYELIVGSSPDPQFGPVLLFGMGGQLVEVFRDRALALPPLNTTLARTLINETTISHALKGVRGRRPIDEEVLAALLVRFSELVAEQPRIAEIDINPLLASPERVIALDARVVLHPASVADEDLPRLAIRPYPHEYEREAVTDDGVTLRVRPVRPEDEPAVARFHAALSPETVVARYGVERSLEERTAHDRLRRIVFADYDRQFALVAEVPGSGELAGIARVSRIHASDDRRLTMTVADGWQRRGRRGAAARGGDRRRARRGRREPGRGAGRRQPSGCASCWPTRGSRSRSATGPSSRRCRSGSVSGATAA